jgi:integrase
MLALRTAREYGAATAACRSRAALRRDLPWLAGVVRARRPRRLPVVLSRLEVEAVLGRLHGIPWLMAALLYGAGLRLMECVRLRVKDLDFASGTITVREGKGRQDRVTMLPAKVAGPLRAHLDRMRRQHERDAARGAGSVELPHAIARKYTSRGEGLVRGTPTSQPPLGSQRLSDYPASPRRVSRHGPVRLRPKPASPRRVLPSHASANPRYPAALAACMGLSLLDTSSWAS